MAANIRLKLKQGTLDGWSVKERLALASSVKRSGDQNWVSVSRAIKPYGEANRPPDWFSQKNCALQYADLLETAETPKRKRGEKGEVVETPANQIVRKLTIERIEELKRLVQEEQQRYKKLKKEVECIRSGQWDNRLSDMWEQMQSEKRAAEERALEEERKATEEALIRAQGQVRRPLLQRMSESVSSISEADDTTQDSITEQLNVETTDDEALPNSVQLIQPINIEIPVSTVHEAAKPRPPTSPLLSSLLQSKQLSVDGLQQIKAEAEAEHALIQAQAATQQAVAQELTNQKQAEQTAVPIVKASAQAEVSVSQPAGTPTLTKLLGTTASVTTKSTVESTMVPILVPEEHIVEDVPLATEHEEVVEMKLDSECETVEIEAVEIEAASPEKDTVKQEMVLSEEESDVIEPGPSTSSSSFIMVDDEVSIKEEPASPASSVSSRISETGSKTSGRKRKGKLSTSSRRSSGRLTRRSGAEDERKEETQSRASEVETSDDDGDDHSSTANLGQSGVSVLSDSIPNSPLSHCSDTEDDKAYKTWKKSIMLVWRAAANHKYANVFLHPVTDDIAPGYASVVRRPKNLTTIKRHIENGMIRTTPEFQRDMMLMFTNAIMYNSSNHDVYKMAMEMYDDVMLHIEQYVSTQLMVQSTETKQLRQSRRNESSDKEEESRRRRTSSEAGVALEGGKIKKRKGRGEDT